MSQPHTQTRHLLETYLDAALCPEADRVAASPDPMLAPASPPRSRWRQFRVGSFRFVLPAAAVQATDGEGAVRVSGLVLVPARYRAQAGVSLASGSDVVVLKGGRVAIVGCLASGELDVAEDLIQCRGVRPDTPWIAGTLAVPPCFVLDSVALQLHFERRGGAG